MTHRHLLILSLLTPLSVAAQAPSVSAVLNAATMQAGAITAGSQALLSGANLGPSASASSFPLPTTLGGTTVTINGRSAPLLTISANQILSQAPWELTPGPASIVVTSNGVPSTAFNASVAAISPGIFTSGNLQIQHADTSPVNASNPATAGETIVAYAVGLGAVSNP